MHFFLVELQTLKTYIKTYLKSGFIWLFKSPTYITIFFDGKFDNNFRLYIDYQGLDNLTIKNWYLFSLSDELLD